MQVERVPLPGSASAVVVLGGHQRVLVDWTLTRDQAALAVQGLLPHAHADVIDHWLDTAYPRRMLPFSARALPQIGALAGAALALTAIFTPHVMARHHGGQTVRRAPIVLAVPDTHKM